MSMRLGLVVTLGTAYLSPSNAGPASTSTPGQPPFSWARVSEGTNPAQVQHWGLATDSRK